MTTKNVLKRGSPELEDSEKRSVITQFHCTAEDRERMQQAAEKSGKGLSDWLIEVAVRAAKRA